MVAAIGRSGGARVGAGRKPGTGVVRTQARVAVNMAKELGLQPIEVILYQMKTAHEESIKLRAELQGLIAAGGKTGDEMNKIIETTDAMFRYFEMARVRAVDAAPYVHARLASVTLEGNSENPIEVRQSFDAFVAMLDDIARDKVAGATPKLLEASDQTLPECEYTRIDHG